MSRRKLKKPAAARVTDPAAKKKPVDPFAGTVNRAPFSWELSRWPADVWPHTPTRGRRLVLAHRQALIDALAISRPEKNLVVFGSAYHKWLLTHRDKVKDFDLPMNAGGAEE